MNKPFLTKLADKFIFFSLLFLCLAIFLPVFFKSLAITIFALSLVIAYLSKTYSLEKNFTLNYFNLTLVVLYLFYVIGMFWSTDMKYGLFDLQVKLPLLILPLLFLILPKHIMTKQTFWYCALVFIGAMIISIFYSFTAGIIRSINNNTSVLTQITYTNLISDCSYYAFCTCTAMILTYKIPLIKLFNIKSISSCVIKYIIFILIVVDVVFLESRSGFISLIIAIIYIVVDDFFLQKQKEAAAGMLIAFIIILFCLLNIEGINERYFGTIQTANTYPGNNYTNTHISEQYHRMFVYKNIYKVIFKHPIYGVGTGDTKIAIKDLYTTAGNPFNRYLNAHNQFLQTTISLGVLGLIVLLCTFVMPLKRCIKQKDYFVIAILCIIGIGFMFESMLERNIGVYPFAVIYSLITFYLVIDNQNYPTNSPKE